MAYPVEKPVISTRSTRSKGPDIRFAAGTIVDMSVKSVRSYGQFLCCCLELQGFTHTISVYCTALVSPKVTYIFIGHYGFSNELRHPQKCIVTDEI